MRRRLAWCLLPPALLACGDVVVQPSGSTTSAGTPHVTVDGGVSMLLEQLPPTCPVGEPESGAILVYMDGGAVMADDPAPTCGGSGGECEYGTSADRACNRVYACTDEQWSAQPSGERCYDLACPSSSEAIAQLDGHACDLGSSADASGEAICDVADGTCACTTGGGAHARTWVCTKTPLDCPLHRPHLGTSCDRASQFCDYGACASKQGTAVMCQGGRWVETTASCARF